MRTGRTCSMVWGAALGATAAFFLDPTSGRRRRALVRDKLRHYGATMPRRAGGDLQYAAGRTTGALYRVLHPLVRCQRESLADDVDTKHRIESELGRDPVVPMSHINFDVVEGLVHVRGRVAEAARARHIVEQTAGVDGVRAVISLLRLTDGTPVGGMAGDVEWIDARPRAEVHGEAVRQAMLDRWPVLSDADILASAGYLGKLSAQISERTGEPQEAVRAEVEEILLAAA